MHQSDILLTELGMKACLATISTVQLLPHLLVDYNGLVAQGSRVNAHMRPRLIVTLLTEQCFMNITLAMI